MLYNENGILFTDDIATVNFEKFCGQPSLVLIYCRQGLFSLSLDGKQKVINPGEFLVSLPGIAIESFMHSNDISGVWLSVDESIFQEILHDCFSVEPLWWQKRNYVVDNSIAKPSEEELPLVEAYINLLSIELARPSNPKREKLIRMLADAALCEVLSSLDERIHESNMAAAGNMERKDFIMQDFFELLSRDGSCNHTVEYYAGKLNVSSKYLSGICRDKTGKGAMSWIQDILLAEVNRMLLGTELSVKEIAFRTGFSEVSLLCRWYRSRTGTSPLKYRSQYRMQ